MLWGPAFVPCPGWRGRPCHRKCSHRGPPGLALRWDHPPNSDNWGDMERNGQKREREGRESRFHVWKTSRQRLFWIARRRFSTSGSSWSCSQRVWLWGCLLVMPRRPHNMHSYKKKNTNTKKKCGWDDGWLANLNLFFPGGKETATMWVLIMQSWLPYVWIQDLFISILFVATIA